MNNKDKTALITGITGQDGSYLAEFLLTKGYKVIGMTRHSSTNSFERISHILNRITLVSGDLLDQSSINNIIDAYKPNEVYNLAAQSFVPASWEQPILTSEVTGLGVTRILEAIRTINKNIKFYQASSSEMFGRVYETPQNEFTPFYPRSPYGVAKTYGHYITVNYRESYDIFAVSGILFNHESPRRGKEFVTRKISSEVARIALGQSSELHLGNLDTLRDWGFAGDYIQAMWLMLQQSKPSDFVIATGENHSVREFCEIAFNCIGLNYKDFVVTDNKFCRPAEVDKLLGNPFWAKEILKWEPTVNFKQLVEMMVASDLKILEKELE